MREPSGEPVVGIIAVVAVRLVEQVDRLWNDEAEAADPAEYWVKWVQSAGSPRPPPVARAPEVSTIAAAVCGWDERSRTARPDPRSGCSEHLTRSLPWAGATGRGLGVLSVLR